MKTESDYEQWQKVHDKCLEQAMKMLDGAGNEAQARELVITAGIAVDKMGLLRKAH